MHYVLVNNGSVILGPVAWNYRMFQKSLNDDLEITGVQLPTTKDDATPIVIDANTRILSARYATPPVHNPRIEFLQGPYWTFDNDEAVGSYVVENLQIEAAKNFLKEQAANVRWKQEVAGIKVTIQGKDYTVDTNRGSRDIFLQAVQLGVDGKTWKFPEGWVVLSLAELQTIVTAVITHVQARFAWEAQTAANIEAATILNDLINIEIPNLNPPQNEE